MVLRINYGGAGGPISSGAGLASSAGDATAGTSSSAAGAVVNPAAKMMRVTARTKRLQRIMCEWCRGVLHIGRARDVLRELYPGTRPTFTILSGHMPYNRTHSRGIGSAHENMGGRRRLSRGHQGYFVTRRRAGGGVGDAGGQ